VDLHDRGAMAHRLLDHPPRDPGGGASVYRKYRAGGDQHSSRSVVAAPLEEAGHMDVLAGHRRP